MTTSELAERLRQLAVETLEALERRHLPDWRIPRVFAGHAVGADVRADLCFTLAHLTDAGVPLVAGEHPDAITARLLRDVDGRATHTFFSYRIAETLARHGPIDGNPLLAGYDDAQRQQVVLATDSSDWLLVTRNRAFLESTTVQGAITPWPSNLRGPIVWTDDYSDLFRVLSR